MSEDEILRGTFREIVADPVAPEHPIATAHAALLRELSPLVAPRIHINPHPEEFEDTADYILRVAKMVDRWLLAVGAEVKCNSTAGVNLEMFRDQFIDATEGWCTAECDKAAAECRSEYDYFDPNEPSPTDPNSLWRMLTGKPL